MKKNTKQALVSNWRSLAKYLIVFIFLIAIRSQAETQSGDLVSLDSVESNPVENRGVVYRAPDFGTSYVEEYQSKSEFRYEEAVQGSSWWEEFKSWLNQLWFKFLELLFGSMDSSGVSVFISQLAPYLLLLLFMGVMVWIALKFGAGSNPTDEIRVAGLTTDELLLQRRDLHALAAEALSRQDFRLAVRYRYLEALQLLMSRKLIEWKSFKTNRDYLLELQGNVLQSPFSEVTRIYNFVWYGHFELDEVTFVDLESSFHQIKEHA